MNATNGITVSPFYCMMFCSFQLKAVSHEIEIAQVRLISKSGGKNTYTASS